MTNNITQLREIKAGAPEGATHIDAEMDYWICDGVHCTLIGGISFSQSQQITMRSLSDINTIIEQAEEIARLREVLEVALDFGNEPLGGGLKNEIKEALNNDN